MKKVSFKGSAMLNPVPCVLITSQDSEGKPNVFTVGWIGTACTKPPMLTVAIRKERLSYKNIVETKEFVVNLPSTKMTKMVDYCGVVSGKKEDKIKKFNMKLQDSQNISVKGIAECPINIECKLVSITELGTHDLFLASIEGVSVDESLIDEKGKIHFEKANLLSYCHGEYFGLIQKPLGNFGFSVRKKK